MSDITMTQIGRATHHFRALIDVDPANLNPTVDLYNFLDADGKMQKMIDSILQDPGIEATIEAEFEAQSSSVTKCKFVPNSLQRFFAPGNFSAGGRIIGMEISLDIATVAPIVEQGAIEMKFEFLHTDMR
jgi:hypothetical protein